MLRIVTDGVADLPAGWGEVFDIQIVPINIHFGEETFLQYIEMDLEAFYNKVDTSSVFPKTSQPSPHQFAEFYKTNAEEGDTILSIHVTSKLSGTYASAVIAAEDQKFATHWGFDVDAIEDVGTPTNPPSNRSSNLSTLLMA